MLKFFRKIRQQLVSENLPDQQTGNFSKYLLYAIGEIILVVIGILIALQINNWNTQHTEKQSIQKYYSQLQTEFAGLAKHETFRLEQSNLLLKSFRTCQQLMSKADPKNIPAFKTCLPYLRTTWQDRPQYPIFQEFINEGWMSKIENAATKDWLIKVREQLLLIEEMDVIINKKYEEWIVPFFAKNVNRTELPVIANFIDADSLIKGGPPTDFAQLLNSMELWGMLDEKQTMTTFYAIAQQDLIDLLKEGNEMLDR